MSDSLRPHGVYSPWNSPGQNTGVSSLSLFQGATQSRSLFFFLSCSKSALTGKKKKRKERRSQSASPKQESLKQIFYLPSFSPRNKLFSFYSWSLFPVFWATLICVCGQGTGSHRWISVLETFSWRKRTPERRARENLSVERGLKSPRAF